MYVRAGAVPGDPAGCIYPGRSGTAVPPAPGRMPTCAYTGRAASIATGITTRPLIVTDVFLSRGGSTGAPEVSRRFTAITGAGPTARTPRPGRGFHGRGGPGRTGSRYHDG